MHAVFKFCFLFCRGKLGNVEVAAAKARGVAVSKVSASISQRCVARSGIESE